MADPEKKEGLLAIVGLAKPKGKAKPDEDESPAEAADEYEMAADEVFDAVKADDRPAFREALRAYVDMCMSKGKGEESGEGEEY